MSAEFVTLSACIDCVQYAAGITAEETGQAFPAAVIEAPARISRDNGGARISIVPEIEEPHFSWSPCEVCLSTLGGDRYAVTLVIEERRWIVEDWTGRRIWPEETFDSFDSARGRIMEEANRLIAAGEMAEEDFDGFCEDLYAVEVQS